MISYGGAACNKPCDDTSKLVVADAGVWPANESTGGDGGSCCGSGPAVEIATDTAITTWIL
jgi:hypothetical protein